MRFRRLLIGVFVTLAALRPCAGQDVPMAPPAAETPDRKNQQLEWLRIQAAAQTDYMLGPGDTIHVEVLNVPEINSDILINQSGTIDLPFIGAVRVQGLTTHELQAKLESLFGERLLKNPNVTVAIKEYRSRPVYVLGEVNRAGTYQLTHFMRLVDLLTLAGGFTGAAGDICTVTRTGPEGQSTKFEIDLHHLLAKGDISLNIPIESGDMIHVAKRLERLFFVLGDVGKPGAYPIPPNKAVSLSEALSTAGGFNRTAKLNESRLVRLQPDGSRTMQTLDVKKILAGKLPDIALQDNDLLYVPDSKSKMVGYSFLNSLNTFAYGAFWALAW